MSEAIRVTFPLLHGAYVLCAILVSVFLSLYFPLYGDPRPKPCKLGRRRVILLGSVNIVKLRKSIPGKFLTAVELLAPLGSPKLPKKPKNAARLPW